VFREIDSGPPPPILFAGSIFDVIFLRLQSDAGFGCCLHVTGEKLNQSERAE